MKEATRIELLEIARDLTVAAIQANRAWPINKPKKGESRGQQLFRVHCEEVHRRYAALADDPPELVDSDQSD